MEGETLEARNVDSLLFLESYRIWTEPYIVKYPSEVET